MTRRALEDNVPNQALPAHDAERAAIAELCAGLSEHGVESEVIVLAAVTTDSGRRRTVMARDGVFRWDTGLTIGPLDDVPAAVEAVLATLGRRP